MPKTPIDYSKTVIYKICCKDITTKDCYVGSTNDFNRRKANHKHTCYNEDHKDHNLPVYEFIRSHGDWVNWSMIPVELFKTCTNKLEKLARERYYVEQLNATLNSCIPGRAHKDYHTIHKEYYKEYHKRYNAKRIETKIKYPCGGWYDLTNKTQHLKSQRSSKFNFIKRHLVKPSNNNK